MDEMIVWTVVALLLIFTASAVVFLLMNQGSIISVLLAIFFGLVAVGATASSRREPYG